MSAWVIGEALIDIVQHAGAEPVEHPGGSPANVALGLARLGRETELVTWIGTDARGEAIREHLRDSGVRLSSRSTDAARTSTALARIGGDGAADYVFDLDWSLPVQHPGSPPRVVHTGSIASVLEPGAGAVATMVEAQRATSTITYDPNARPQIMTDHAAALAAVEAQVGRSDVVKASDEDLEWLYPGIDPLRSAATWLESGPAMVVVTRGAQGSWARTSAGVEAAAPPRPVQVADTVGAGDSLMGALIDGLWDAQLLGAEHRDALHAVDAPLLRRILDHAAAVAAITCSRPGADPPSRAELAEWNGS